MFSRVALVPPAKTDRHSVVPAPRENVQTGPFFLRGVLARIRVHPGSVGRNCRRTATSIDGQKKGVRVTILLHANSHFVTCVPRMEPANIRCGHGSYASVPATS